MQIVEVARAYSIFFWINTLIITFIIAVATAGFGIILLPIAIWYKLAVINRTKIIYEENSNRLTFWRGRWFIKDDDVVPLKAIDNVKLDRSIFGKLFGWTNITIETRSENYEIDHVATRSAETFRQKFLDAI